MTEHPQDRDPPWVDLTWAIAQRKCLHDIVKDEPLLDFGGYEALETIEGGMGLVIVARDPNLDRKVAIKLCKSLGPEAALAMLGEAQALARLSHPNVVTIYGVGESELGVFLVMEFVDGLDAEAWLTQKLRSLAEILEVFIGAGEGLAAAHEAGIQHGDFKPANVLIGRDGRVRVADFGVAEVMRETTLDELFGGGVAGTPEYMAPERLRGERGDARSDQFSFCVALIRALYDERPFEGRSRSELLASIETGGPQFGVPSAPVPSGLEQVLRKGLSRNPDDRYPSMRELLDALRSWQDDDIDDVTQLLKNRPMAAWGPLIDRGAIGLQVEDKLVMSTGLDEDEVAELLDLEPRRYLLLERLSNTHHATVYAALDGLLNRDVVVKIHRDLRAHAMQLALRESQVLANVVHPNVVQIYDIGEYGRWLYSVIEPCELDLRQWHRDRSRHWRVKLARIIEVGHGLSYLHELGYAHGDIKPGNILIQDSTAKLADFGHVTIPRPGDQREGEGHGGTVGYVAPDVYRSGPSHVGDVFALAVTTFNLLFDGKPFGEAKTIAEGVRLVEAGELRWPETLPEGLPKSVLPLLVRALDADPDKRPSLGELLRGLQSAIDQRKRRLRWAAVSTAAATLLVVGFSIGALLRPLRSAETASVPRAALRGVDPLARAEIAARIGDGETAVAELEALLPRTLGMSADDLEQLSARTTRIANILSENAPAEARLIRRYAQHFSDLQHLPKAHILESR